MEIIIGDMSYVFMDGLEGIDRLFTVKKIKPLFGKLEEMKILLKSKNLEKGCILLRNQLPYLKHHCSITPKLERFVMSPSLVPVPRSSPPKNMNADVLLWKWRP